MYTDVQVLYDASSFEKRIVLGELVVDSSNLSGPIFLLCVYYKEKKVFAILVKEDLGL